MGAYNRTYSLTNGNTAYGDQVVYELDALGSSVNNITDAQISSGANVSDSKLAQITTASKVSGAAITLLTSLPSAAGEIPVANAITGSVVQVVNAPVITTPSGITAFNYTNSIPQITDGDEYLSAAITPKSSTNKLKIDVVLSYAAASGGPGAGIFKVGTANALYAAPLVTTSTGVSNTASFSYFMTAGGTSEITFKVRAGSNAGTFYMNTDYAGTRLYGGVCASSITITEIKA
jgi:hypothetical protein